MDNGEISSNLKSNVCGDMGNDICSDMGSDSKGVVGASAGGSSASSGNNNDVLGSSNIAADTGNLSNSGNIVAGCSNMSNSGNIAAGGINIPDSGNIARSGNENGMCSGTPAEGGMAGGANESAASSALRQLEQIGLEVKRQIEEERGKQESFNSWLLSIHDRSGLMTAGESLKEYLKRTLLMEYPRRMGEQYSTTIEIEINERGKARVQLVNETLYVAGRYRKTIRGISNTPMIIVRRSQEKKGKRAGQKRRTKGGSNGDNRETYESESTAISPLLGGLQSVYESENSEAGSVSSFSDAVGQCATAEIRMRAVSDWIEPIKQYFDGKEAVFMSSGREDIDVRMLGKGRPFIVRIEKPRRNLPRALESLVVAVSATGEEVEEQCVSNQEIRINYQMSAAVELLDLALVKGKEACRQMKEIEQTKKKEYQVSVMTKLAPEAVRASLVHQGWLVSRAETPNILSKDLLTLRQKTPIRVVHRRANLERARQVYNCVIEIRPSDDLPDWPDNGTQLVVHLVADAGTYIKEFVNGDLGRTTPSLTELLGGYCDVVELDVLNIEANFPVPETILTPIRLV
ncbi:tRNA pseudouridine synthase 10 [Nematocida homosporus]|uniref:tRNA pseudouridine synthase 10 n=1 Tax=Nematocida homosporus TaxID=1912981 RepID=UPI0022209ECE|nr:tRNA pseudouridine synthase 10 [Nematocida homosporus]KAI5184366.1 tRNA pseudouridine synthase 10 [Nematocida homosporus]